MQASVSQVFRKLFRKLAILTNVVSGVRIALLPLSVRQIKASSGLAMLLQQVRAAVLLYLHAHATPWRLLALWHEMYLYPHALHHSRMFGDMAANQ